MAASEALFQELAKALGQPSKTYRAAAAGLAIPGQAMQGYETGAEFADKIRQRKLAQQTLLQTLGQMPAGTEQYGNLTQEQFKPTAEILTGIGALEKAQRAGLPDAKDFMTKDQATKALLGIQGGKLDPADEDYFNSFPNGQIPRLDVSSYASNKTTRHGQTLSDERGKANTALRNKAMSRMFGKDFDSDPDVVRAFTERNQSQRAKQVLTAGNPVGDASVRVIAARAAGEVGNLAQNEQAVFGGSPALTDWLARNAQRITTGKLDETDRGYLNELFDVYSNYADSRINQRKQYHASRFSEISELPLDEAGRMIGDISQLGVGGVQQPNADNRGGGGNEMTATATNAQGVKIQTMDGGKTWRPVGN